MRYARFWLGVLVGLGAWLGLTLPARAQEAADECCALPAPTPAGAWWQILQVAQKAEAGKQPGVVIHTHKCVHVAAAEAERMLKRLLGGDGAEGATGGRLALAVDSRTNTMHMAGPAARIAQAREFLGKIDIEVPGQPPVVLGPPTLQGYSVGPGQAERVANILQQIHKGSTTVIVALGGPDRVFVWANPEEQLTIARELQKVAPPTIIEVIPLTVTDAPRVGQTLSAMLGARGLFIESDPARNALLVKGTQQQIRELREALRALGEGAASPTGNVRVITVPSGSAVALAEYVQQMLRPVGRLGERVRIIMPGQKEAAPVKPAPAKGGALIDPGKGANEPPLTVIVAGNKLILHSSDPETMALAQELIGLACHRSQGGDFEVIYLRHAKAPAIARILEEVFNGPEPGDRKQAPGEKGALPSREDRVRVVADPTINALLVRASPLDILTIRRLLERSLDTADAAFAEPQLRPYVLGPFKYAKAAELAKILEAVYRPASARKADPARPAPTLTIGVDDRANTLVLRCGQPLYDEIRRLTEQLEQLHRDAKK
jgi:type II secretory pathway component GspD/PulD (secretin)